MTRDKLILIGLTMSLILFMLVSFELSGQFPFLVAVLFIFATSLLVFIAFMKNINKHWYQRGFIVNSSLVILLPIIEGMFFLVISVFLLAILAFTQLAVYQLHKS